MNVWFVYYTAAKNYPRIIAGTARDNLASQRVLLKNGFTFGWIIENDLKINNEWVDTAVFEITRS